ncbi:MAG: hypothetical protein LAP85_08445 [Acidobacteriia bacterium]|nr:hypothetical protein [Terriglobia bacterium]
MTLDEGAFGKETLFDLTKRTVKFTPDGAGYRVETLPLKWDADFGAELSGAQIALKKFTFPFSGKNWDSLTVGVNGSIAFPTTTEAGAAGRGGAGAQGRGGAGGAQGGGRGGMGGGISVGDRFAQLQDVARTLVNTQPAILVFFRLRFQAKPNTPSRYVKELDDRVVITWDVTEPYGGIQDWSWVPTGNRFQAVLYKDGSVEMSYETLNAKDANVGLYPMATGGAEQAIATLNGKENPAVAGHLNIQDVKLSSVGGMFLKVALDTRGAPLQAGDPGAAGVTYRVTFTPSSKAAAPAIKKTAKAAPAVQPVVWVVRAGGMGRGGNRGGAPTGYAASGPGVSPAVKVEGNTISIQGILPAELAKAGTITVAADVSTRPAAPAAAQGAQPASAGQRITPTTVDELAPQAVKLAGLHSPEVDLSSITAKEGPFPIVYESFHYVSKTTMMRDLPCTVIQGLGDNFDFLVYYSDFRIDDPEAGTSSNGPRGGDTGPYSVQGLRDRNGNPAAYCSQGRFQWEWIQPVYSGSNQMQERSPEGVIAPRAGGPMTGYDYAMSQVAHELGHRWSAFVRAKVGNDLIELGPTHWQRGLQAPVAFPYKRTVEASLMGGGVWQDNFDGTFTQLDDDYYVPATGWSYLELYLMGLATPAEVPDFFLLRNLVPAGRDANGPPIFKADRTKITVNDVIAAEGLRTPTPDKSQRKFNTGIVLIAAPGAKSPKPDTIKRANEIAAKWIEHFSITTGRRASMTVSPSGPAKPAGKAAPAAAKPAAAKKAAKNGN